MVQEAREFMPALDAADQIDFSKKEIHDPGFLFNRELSWLEFNQRVLDLALDSSCLLYTSPSPRDKRQSRMPSSA